ncbi:hypothetical protein [Natrinema saccharevitans]|nr:hypothetical protein [Natrinema saccharevitans]
MASHTGRWAYVVDPDGVIRLELEYPIEIGQNIDKILRSKGLFKRPTRAMWLPVDWPNNANFDDRVLLESPSDVATAEKRLARIGEKNYEWLDWWFRPNGLE